MAEPEDLILDGAYVASRLARDIWRRYGPAAAERVLRLADVRARLELFLHALFGSPIPVSAAELAAPVSWLGRLAGRRGDAGAATIAGTDGVRILLPPVIDALRGADVAFQLYQLLAVEQAVRLLRGSATIDLEIENDEIHDWFSIAEAAAVDHWIVHHTAGLIPALRSARRAALTQRASPIPRGDRERAIDDIGRAFLACDPQTPFAALPLLAAPADALAWAREQAHHRGGYRRAPGVWYWGRARLPIQGLDGATRDAEETPHTKRPGQRRVAEMRRRPRIRNAAEDEDDPGKGTWVVRPDEPQESVEDPLGLQRPADRADDVDPESLGDSLSELPEARVVRTPGQVKEVLRAGDDRPRTSREAVFHARPGGVAYPEWDYRTATYRPGGAIVREVVPPLGDPFWAQGALARHRRLVWRVRSRFERLRPRRVRITRQTEGPEIDIAEYVAAAADARAGVAPDDRLHVDVRPGRRELSVALLVDVSASTDSWVSGHQRIVDVEKDALLVVCEALGALGDPFTILAFAGEGAEHVSIVSLKRFDEHLTSVVRQRIAALESDGYTRIGAAIRHATTGLTRRFTARRLLLILSDGKPNDVDAYEGWYGIEDARQAVAEARRQGVDLFCLTVDREAPSYAPRIFGRARFAVLRRPDQLPEVLIEVMRRLILP